MTYPCYHSVPHFELIGPLVNLTLFLRRSPRRPLELCWCLRASCYDYTTVVQCHSLVKPHLPVPETRSLTRLILAIEGRLCDQLGRIDSHHLHPYTPPNLYRCPLQSPSRAHRRELNHSGAQLGLASEYPPGPRPCIGSGP